MTYSSGSLIEDVDYNGFANNTAGANVNSIWGVGSGDSGWGQPTTLATVADGTLITATQWANLNNRISSIANQTGTTITSRANPVAGDTIGILAALNTDLTNCNFNRGYAVSSGTISSTWSGDISKITNTGSGQSAWTITFTQTINFGTADQARYFFNAGGLVRLDMSKISASEPSADSEWNAFVGRVGALVLSGRVNSTNQVIAGTSYSGFTRIGGSGSPTINSSTTGWYQLAPGAAPTTMFQLFDSATGYTGNYIQVSAQKNAGSTTLTFTTIWVSAGTSVPGSTANISGGTPTSSPYVSFGTAPTVLCRFIPPSTTFLTNTWGTPSISSTVT